MAKQSKNLRLRETIARFASLRASGAAGCEDANHDSRDGDLAGE
jgi:hypothetical protein